MNEVTSLKPFSQEYTEIIFHWRNKLRIRKSMLDDKEILWEEHLEWVANLNKREDYKLNLFFKKDIPVGVVNYTLDLKNNIAEWGFYLGEENLPKGTGKLMGETGLNYAFKVLKVEKVKGIVLEQNIISQNFHESLKFKNEGFLREEVIKDNQRQGLYCYGLLRSEWLKYG